MLTLLVADSNLSICEQIYDFCSGLSEILLIKCVHNGSDALDVILNEHIDVLLMDTIMPVLDGVGLLTRLDECDYRPFVFVHTAFLSDRVLSELHDLGAMYCFVKPMKAEYIIQRILRLISRDSDAAPIKVIPFNSKETEMYDEITRHIRAVGVPAHLLGYHYMRAGIQFSVDASDPSSIAVTKDIYPHIAKLFGKRPALIERSIRNAIEVAWTRGNTETLNEYFGYTINDNKGKPTNAEFIAMIADRVRMSTK